MNIGDVLTTHTFVIELGAFQVETCQEVSALTYGQDVIECKQVTSTGELISRKQPGASQGGEITITRGMDQSKAFTDWVKETRQNHSLDTARQNIGITVLDATKRPVRRLQLVNAWASSWQGPALQAGNASPAMETVTIQFEDCIVE